MSDPKDYPYVTNLNVQYQALELIDEKALADSSPHQWYNQTLCNVNDSVVRLGVVQGEYHWHKHDDDDEFFGSEQESDEVCASGQFGGKSLIG